ncbi:MAG: hypothetical protein JWN25_1652 [Verrucomicrobiales bacterium]|nr:hypothetical protein [Verrucomicrobiales bacterium]
MLACYCPGGFVLAGILSVVPLCLGTRLAKSIALVVLIASVFAGIHAAKGLEKSEKRAKQIQAISDRKMEEQFGPGWRTNKDLLLNHNRRNQ